MFRAPQGHAALSLDLPMTTRILPPPDVSASCPLDGNILEYYGGTFEAVYVSLNPFIKPISIDSAEFQARDVSKSREYRHAKRVDRCGKIATLKFLFQATDSGPKPDVHSRNGRYWAVVLPETQGSNPLTA